jgi:DNA-binding Lrp family transcriptional regulator
VKNVELKLICELMKNSRRSDRELAKAIGVSQPTVSRLVDKLEKSGVIREYTIIPDFNKLGYHLCALTFADFQTPKDVQAMRKLIEEYGKRLSEIPQAVMIERGIGERANGVVISLHESYSDYIEFQKWLKQFGSLSNYELHDFIIDLADKVHYRYLTFSTIAEHVLELMEKREKAQKPE